MNFNEYQKIARETAVYPGHKTPVGLSYCALKLAGEAGEVAQEVGKAIRDDDLDMTAPQTMGNMTGRRRMKLIEELGDVLWYVSAMASELGYNLNDVAVINADKLHRRKLAGQIKGDHT